MVCILWLALAQCLGGSSGGCGFGGGLLPWGLGDQGARALSLGMRNRTHLIQIRFGDKWIAKTMELQHGIGAAYRGRRLGGSSGGCGFGAASFPGASETRAPGRCLLCGCSRLVHAAAM
mgnify:CR=1 FL=1